jgi:transposase
MDRDSGNAMLQVMDEAMHEDRHEGHYRRIELITGRRQRRNWTSEEKARIVAESAEPDVNISAVARRWGVNRGLLNVWRREAGLTSQRSGEPSSRQPLFVPVTVVGDRNSQKAGTADGRDVSAGQIEIEIAGARMVVTGSVAPELARAMVAALRGGR